MLDRLLYHKLDVPQSKCSFMQTESEVLEVIAEATGMYDNPQKTKIMKEWPIPKSIAGIRSCLGLVSVFPRFLEGNIAIKKLLT